MNTRFIAWVMELAVLSAMSGLCSVVPYLGCFAILGPGLFLGIAGLGMTQYRQSKLDETRYSGASVTTQMSR